MPVDPTVEISVIQEVAAQLKKLEGDQPSVGRVLDWARSAFLTAPTVQTAPPSMAQGGGFITPPSGASNFTGGPPTLTPASSGPWASIADLYAEASPTTDADRALVVGFYMQKVLGQGDLDGFSINKELRNLGYRASNITSALNQLMSQRPQLVIQTHKSGNSKQARKKYRLTSEGIKAVDKMLNEALLK